MSASQTEGVVRDERTVAVENVGYKWAFIFLMYALFINVIYRGVVLNEAAWDLMALVCLSGFIITAYQARQKALPHGWGRDALFIFILGGIIAAVSAFIVMMYTK